MLKFFTLLCALAIAPLLRAGQAEHVLLITWDGLRPDSVTKTNTPTLWKLAQAGTIFSKHHAAYPSTTEVNGTTLATGMYPAHSGLMGNREYRPLVNPIEPVAMESLLTVRLADRFSQGKYLAVPTMYETLHAAGFATAVAGTKAIALLPDRGADRAVALLSPTVFEGNALTAELRAQLDAALGEFPEKVTFPDVAQNKWTVDALLNVLWKDQVPKLSLLWLSDPDFSQHATQPGAPIALASLKANDKLLARVLATLDAKGIRDKTDILLVSDHGFSTVNKVVNFSKLLTEAGFRAFRKFTHVPAPGDILVVNNGSVFFYVTGHDPETTAKLVRFLQQNEACSVLFSRDSLPGTFPLSAAHIDSPDAPDVVAALTWSSAPNASGVKGLIAVDRTADKKTGQGMHGSLSPYDMHNTLIASGPDFRRTFVDELPTGNIDVAPTILALLGVAPTQKMDGRVLREAFTQNSDPLPKAETHILDASLAPAPLPVSKKTTEQSPWRQYLKISSVEGTEYFDQGNNGAAPQ